MKNRFKKIFSLLFCLLMLTQLFATVAFASPSETKDVDEVVDWELSDDESTLSNGSKTYYGYAGDGNFYLDASFVYAYSDMVELEDDGSSRIFAPYEDAEIVWLEGYDHIYIYATEKGARALDAFLEGDSVTYRLENGESYNTATLDSSVVPDLDAAAGSAQKKTVEVGTLKNEALHHIVAYDTTDTFAYIHGAVYVLDGAYYYVNYLTLGNQYFDADGNFSYRSGTVELIALNSTQSAVVQDAVESQSYRYAEYGWESDEWLGSDVPEGLFWFGIVLFGFLMPIPFLVIGLVLPNSSKRGYPKYWYALAVIAAVWMILAAILTGIMLLA